MTDSKVLLYQSEDGKSRIEIRLENESLWLNQAQIAELFQITKQDVSLHLKNIYFEGELAEDASNRPILTAPNEDSHLNSQNLERVNLEAILAIGYRVRSPRGAQFRKWATQTLIEFLVKGFAMDDERLKRAGGENYFEELLARIRDIRSSEKVFWNKVLDIYATSIDYDGSAEASQKFFKTVQNKMHWAAHGHAAAEILSQRADSTKPNMGLTSWTGDGPKKSDVGIAKNYLNQEELETLNRIVTAYLEFAELQAMSRKPMHMSDWISKLEDFLKLSEREILTHAGRISHTVALAKAEAEFIRFQTTQINKPNRVEKDFRQAIEQVKSIDKKRRIGKQQNDTGKEKNGPK